MPTTSPRTVGPDDPGEPPSDHRAYISDMLSELAEIARRLGDRRLEYSLRLLALDAASPG